MLGARSGRGPLLAAHDERGRALPAVEVADVCRLVDKLVERDEQEVAVHDLDDWPEALLRCAERSAENRAFSDRCVEDSLGAELAVEPAGDPENTAGDRDVLSEKNDFGILGELATQSLVESGRDRQRRRPIRGWGWRRPDLGWKEHVRRGCRGIRRGLCQRVLRCSLHVGRNRLLESDERVLVSEFLVEQALPEARQRITKSGCLTLDLFAVLLDVGVVVGHETHRLALEERRAAPSACTIGRVRNRSSDALGIVAVDRGAGHAVRGRPVGQVQHRGHGRDRRHLRPVVVLADEDHWQLTRNCHDEPLVRRPLARGTVPERDDDDLPGSGQLSRQADAVGDWQSRADDRVFAEEAVVGRRQVGRPGAPAVRARGPPEDLSEQSADRDPAGDGPAVAAVGRDHTVVRLDRREGTDRDRLLPAAQVHRTSDVIGQAEFEHTLLEPADSKHAPVGG